MTKCGFQELLCFLFIENALRPSRCSWSFHNLDEQIFRFNERENTDSSRFAKAVKGTDCKRLTYAALIGR